jgi:apolipoprotein N-acyltransferase
MTTGRSIFRYAAAAVITGAMALGVYKYVNKPVVHTGQPDRDIATISPVIEKGITMNEQQFNDALNNLTKDDITSYLEKNGSEEDVSMLTSSPDEIDLPNPDDYLLDDKTLENYLNKINFQN